ncbi:Ppx/GppA family phosphatase [Rhodoblastus acidophilus]|uniref:Ppx/GppA family phosphatase n=1 Tax=Candidatus Rhodoblastus alkanivorans TaxID=2954117 RepID=A0ABS9Z5I5_9HYPH|nr:Ppx/GppA family phosphatase [Candidatus Rhodoblastus alkanivorans]MCI4682898.1 Ppx/GppA family phosphatase [Candidatus Rhodoblastus alkanivorans]MDI4640208.1 Ppx/GppA family phosphatase [Rhodoblastus acidophilus]
MRLQGFSTNGDRRLARRSATYAALDLGTNNCRLLVARPVRESESASGEHFRIVDSFSRIVRLGEGLTQTGRLSEAAIQRTIDALLVCREKMAARGVTRSRLIATEACRSAANGFEFIERVRERVGLELEIISRETEARLAAEGCASLADSAAKSVVLFDIGGGSSEIVWLAAGAGVPGGDRIRHWTSLQLGVVTLAERFGGAEVSYAQFSAMTDLVEAELQSFLASASCEERCQRFHLLGTSGTVTTLAGVHLNLPRYDRRRVDGLWMSRAEIDAVMNRLRRMSYAERSQNSCIGPERADLVLAGCAILEGIRRCFPSERIRIADRGLREGMLLELMRADRSVD